MLPIVSAMRLSRRLKPFDSSDYLYEIKHDGFRSLAYVENRECRLVSRNGNRFHSFGALEQWIPKQLRVENAILDGEIVCPDETGRTIFKHVLFHRGVCRFFAFDVLWLNGEDLRSLSLLERKARLKKLIGRKRSALLYVDHIEHQGRAVFEQACRGPTARCTNVPWQSILRNNGLMLGGRADTDRLGQRGPAVYMYASAYWGAAPRESYIISGRLCGRNAGDGQRWR